MSGGLLRAKKKKNAHRGGKAVKQAERWKAPLEKTKGGGGMMEGGWNPPE